MFHISLSVVHADNSVQPTLKHNKLLKSARVGGRVVVELALTLKLNTKRPPL